MHRAGFCGSHGGAAGKGLAMTSATQRAGAGFPFHTISFAAVLCLGLAASGQLLMPPSGDLNARRAEKEKAFQESQAMNAEMHLLFEVADLVAMAGEATRADFLNLAHDRGEIRFSGGREFYGNGIPDAAEIALLEMVLKAPTYSRAPSGGSNHFISGYFMENLALAAEKLPDFNVRVHRSLAALMTLGKPGHCAYAEHLAWRISGRKVSFDKYQNMASDWLGAEHDLENDGQSNRDEWNAAVAESGPDATPLELLECYVRLAAREEKHR